MLDYSIYRVIANDVYESLNIPEDIYTTFDAKSAEEFYNQYIRDDEYIEALVDIEMQKYDTYGNSPSEVEDIRDAAVDWVRDAVEEIYDNFIAKQQAIKENAYTQIVQTLVNTKFEGVSDVDVEFEKADPEVGMWDDERRIIFTLSTGETITFNVDFEE